MELLQTSNLSGYTLPIILFLAGQSLLFITFLIRNNTNMSNKLKELEVRVSIIEKNEGKIFEKLDEVLEAVHQIDIKLERKADK